MNIYELLKSEVTAEMKSSVGKAIAEWVEGLDESAVSSISPNEIHWLKLLICAAVVSSSQDGGSED